MTAPETLQRLAEAWDAAGVRWALLRGRATLGQPGRDVDLLVHCDDLPAFATTVRSHGGVGYPRWAHPWARRFHLAGVELDVKTELRYRRRNPVATQLADGCLDRRVKTGWLWELSPTDTFWTVLLHCLLDKQTFTERRAAELEASVPLLVRPSAAEAATAKLLPAGWSPDRVVDLVEVRKWSELGMLARELSPGPTEPPLWRRATEFSRAAAAKVGMLAAQLVRRRTDG